MSLQKFHDNFVKAAKRGDIKAVEKYLKSMHLADLDHEVDGMTALAHAMESGNINMIKILTRAGCGQYDEGKLHDRPGGGSPLAQKMKQREKRSGFLEAVKKGDAETVKGYLKDRYITDPNQKKNGKKALSLAMDNGDVEMIKLLVNAGCELAEEGLVQKRPRKVNSGAGRPAKKPRGR